MSNVYEKEVGKGRNKAKVPVTSWQIKAFSIRKLDRKESAAAAPSTMAEAQPRGNPSESRYRKGLRRSRSSIFIP